MTPEPSPHESLPACHRGSEWRTDEMRAMMMVVAILGGLVGGLAHADPPTQVTVPEGETEDMRARARIARLCHAACWQDMLTCNESCISRYGNTPQEVTCSFDCDGDIQVCGNTCEAIWGG